MNKTILTLILLFNFIITYSQGNDKDLVDTFDKYRTLIERKDYDKAFDYYLKDFLKYVPKKDLKKELEKLNNKPYFKYFVDNSKISYKSKIISDTNKKYAVIEYVSYTHICFYENAPKEYIEERKEHWKSIYKGNYEFNQEKNEIITHRKHKLIAIFDESWFFIPYKDKMKPYMNIWLPQNIINELLN